MKRAKVSVTWLAPEQGGRRTPMTEHRYVTISRFDEDGPGWPDGAWSVVLEFAPSVDPAISPAAAEASFLMEGAPHDRLRRGTTFTLHEGRREVAQVRVLEA